MIMKPKSPLIRAVVVAATLGAGVAVALFALREQASDERSEITIAVQDDTFSALVYIAADRGYFRREGLDVTLQRYPSHESAVSAVLLEDADAATASDGAIALRRLRSNPGFRILATLSSTNQDYEIVARRDRGIVTPEDLAGSTIGTERGTLGHFILELFLRSYGVRDDAEIAFMPSPELPRALDHGEIDGLVMGEPSVGRAEAAVDWPLVTFEGPSNYRQYLALLVRDDLAGSRPVGEALLRALLRAERLARRAPQVARDAVVRQLGSERRSEVERDWPEHHFEVSASVGFLVNLESLSRWAIRELPHIEGPVPNYLDLLDLEPLRELRPAAVTIQG